MSKVSEPQEMELWCGVYREGLCFPVWIDSNATVYDFQNAIVNQRKDVNDKFNVDPATLSLYSTGKKVGNDINWFKADEQLEQWLINGRRGDDPYVKMIPAWKLQARYLGAISQEIKLIKKTFTSW
ncbi:hypothetical protein THRCLA_22595 [Thraustotheca clavata]|uniref:Crinkler effector protein N-terminal domain-containing protein n=1 Tax=Thraustotheca clavata TaxID=74557 RepID=A0A1V9YW71_9STRA|nr:hypothetical protein THRCLA_22595 [Thraustotheca clavata]